MVESVWTVEALKEYIDTRWSDLDQRLQQRFEAQEEEVRTARVATERELNLLNELRGNVLTREEYNAKHDSVMAQIDQLKDRINKADGGGVALNRAWGYVIGGLGLLLVGLDTVLRATGH